MCVSTHTLKVELCGDRRSFDKRITAFFPHKFTTFLKKRVFDNSLKIKTDANGNEQWSQSYGDASNEVVHLVIKEISETLRR